jgi:hypothetical protein
MSISRSTKANRDERERILKLKLRFENRITIARYGKESLDAGDYGNALRKFMDYLQIISEVKGTKDIYALRLNTFDPKKELTELMMISHIYFEMARMYDAVPKFQGDVEKCLEQFVHFTANQPFQVVNSEMVRKYLKKSVFKNPDMFRNAYQQIYVQSKKCYIVTFCYGETHPVTQQCREFKDWLIDFSLGQKLVRNYYVLSSEMVPKYQNSFWFKSLSTLMIKPILHLFSKIILPVIIKKC